MKVDYHEYYDQRRSGSDGSYSHDRLTRFLQAVFGLLTYLSTGDRPPDTAVEKGEKADECPSKEAENDEAAAAAVAAAAAAAAAASRAFWR